MGWLSKFFRSASAATPGSIISEMIERESERYRAALDLAKEQGFELVLNPMTLRYVDGFDRNADTEFMRYGWLAPSVFKLADMSPEYNVWELYWRPLTTTDTQP